MDYLSNLWENLFTSLGEKLSNILLALLILIIGYFIAKFVKRFIIKLIKRTGIDEKMKDEKFTLSSFIGKLFYFLIMIFVLMLVLEKLGLKDVLGPIENLLNGFTSYIPNVIGALLVAYIGYMLARIVSQLVELAGDTIQKFTPKLRLPQHIDLVNILKKIVFVFIFIPLLISAFHILDMSAISEPATSMLNVFFEAIPRVILAIIIIVIFTYVARFVSQLVKELLTSLNADSIVNNMNLGTSIGTKSVTDFIANTVYVLIVIFGMLTAFEKLQFKELTEVIDTVLSYAGKILFGIGIIAIGLVIANMFTKALNSKNNPFVVSVVKISIIAIFLAIGLRAMGIADDIINLAFGITLGTVALTVVLSFGLGGRDAAGKQMEKILKKFNDKA